MISLLLSLLAIAAPDSPSAEDASRPAPGAGSPPLGALPAAVREAALASVLLPLPDRMKAVSEPLLGTPYVDDPLGEGEGVDPDPLARYDAFDCQTFVEEVLALSLSADPDQVAWIRQSLRYGDVDPSYATRRHFMELQWIPGNIEAGWLRNTTSEYGEIVHFEREVTTATWRNWGGRGRFAMGDSELPTGIMELDVLPLEEAIAAVDRIRPGSIVLTVREDRAGVPIWITHLGFVVPADEPTIRHASRMKSSLKVCDHALKWYLEHLRTYVNWKAAGIAVLEPVDFGPRLFQEPDSR